MTAVTTASWMGDKVNDSQSHPDEHDGVKCSCAEDKGGHHMTFALDRSPTLLPHSPPLLLFFKFHGCVRVRSY